MIIVQKAVIKKGSKYLIALRSPSVKYFPRHWDFPGGKLEPDENPAAGIEREVWEETSLRIKAGPILSTYDFDLDNAGTNTHRFTIYEAKILSGDVKISDEHTTYKWADKDEIMRLKIEPYIKPFFDRHS